MKWIFGIVGVGLYIMQQVWHSFTPEVTWQLTKRQIEDPSLVTDSMLRAPNYWPQVWMIYWVIVIVYALYANRKFFAKLLEE